MNNEEYKEFLKEEYNLPDDAEIYTQDDMYVKGIIRGYTEALQKAIDILEREKQNCKYKKLKHMIIYPKNEKGKK